MVCVCLVRVVYVLHVSVLYVRVCDGCTVLDVYMCCAFCCVWRSSCVCMCECLCASVLCVGSCLFRYFCFVFLFEVCGFVLFHVVVWLCVCVVC